MAHSHVHGLPDDSDGPDDGFGEASPRKERLVLGAGIALIVVAAIGMLVMWPHGKAPSLGLVPHSYVDATAAYVSNAQCPGVEVDLPTPCRIVHVRLTSGASKGSSATFEVLPTQLDVPTIHPGDRLVLLDVRSAPPDYRYSYYDYQRSLPLAEFTILFAVVVILFGRWQGLRALLGLAASALLLLAFLVPALLRGESAESVALVGTLAIACIALYLAHGFNPRTTVALAGSVLSVLFIAGLAVLAVNLAHISGLADQNAQTLRATDSALDLRGLIVAGIIVGALGILNDVTITQASTVAAIRRSNPTLSRPRLYAEAMSVGRDHVASSVNTLVMAYAGAALPLLLFFAQGSAPTVRILTGELVSTEIIRALVGSIGLIAAVPVTTGLAAYILTPSRSPKPAEEPTTPRWEDFAPVASDDFDPLEEPLP